MLTEIQAPDIQQSELKPSVTRWLKSIGDPVTAGEPLVEIATGNDTVEIIAPATGWLSEIHFRDGQFIRSKMVLGTIKQ